MTPVLDIRGLSKGFVLHHLGRNLAAFDDISFAVADGEFVLIKGANGAGKSTLLRTLYRSYLPQAGQILFRSDHGPIDLARAADVDITHLRRTEIGFVTQFLTARPRVSAEALVAEPLRLAGIAPDRALTEARHWLRTFGVKAALWPAYPTTFSGGEQQKVNLARALIRPRKLLLLDEPTASLDAGARTALVRRLADLKARGAAMIGVFHHPDDVAHLIDRVIDLTPDAPSQEDRHDVVV
ncbi:MAG: alpha-D-ribose 1-methylphosphonate 5-triphosphate synthase subunit PhnL [Rhodobacteraceae bacterium HLUCCA08]|nr:MAG: alpha-D-ribose 1-methylphosphonate 5-triphosphate synthase subunit PhnL [Rhodobacteraceae bacterium HLUCCA08]